MNAELSGRLRNTVFIVFLAITIIMLFFSWNKVSKYNGLYLSDYKQYLKANELVNADKYEEAEPVLVYLSEKYKDSYQVLWLYGLCLSERNKLTQGEAYMSQAREIRADLMMNGNFLLQYGDIMYRLQDYPRAERYVSESKKYIKDTELTKKADLLLDNIKSKPKRG